LSVAHHQPLKNASWYWHFVDVVWLAVFFILYVSPRIYQ
jgi:heme/copper-type cytochrome/quinol oxidase subunit 3